MKTLHNKDGEKFQKLLANQNEETLSAILSLQNDVIERFNTTNTTK